MKAGPESVPISLHANKIALHLQEKKESCFSLSQHLKERTVPSVSQPLPSPLLHLLLSAFLPPSLHFSQAEASMDPLAPLLSSVTWSALRTLWTLRVGVGRERKRSSWWDAARQQQQAPLETATGLSAGDNPPVSWQDSASASSPPWLCWDSSRGLQTSAMALPVRMRITTCRSCWQETSTTRSKCWRSLWPWYLTGMSTPAKTLAREWPRGRQRAAGRRIKPQLMQNQVKSMPSLRGMMFYCFCFSYSRSLKLSCEYSSETLFLLE